jgi:hypothetical protein
MTANLRTGELTNETRRASKKLIHFLHHTARGGLDFFEAHLDGVRQNVTIHTVTPEWYTTTGEGENYHFWHKDGERARVRYSPQAAFHASSRTDLFIKIYLRPGEWMVNERLFLGKRFIDIYQCVAIDEAQVTGYEPALETGFVPTGMEPVIRS